MRRSIKSITGTAFLGLALGVGLLASTTNAHAETVVGTAPPCTLDNIDKVTVSPDFVVHRYSFTVHCYNYDSKSVTGAYDTYSQQVQEAMHDAAGKLQSTGVCPVDPWTAPNADLHCVGVKVSNTAEAYLPLTTENMQIAAMLRPQDRARLADALTVAISDAKAAIEHPAPATQAPAPAGVPLGTKILTQPPHCFACADGPTPNAPTLPDVQVTAVRAESGGQLFAGMTAVYDVVVANTGATLPSPGQVEVSVQVTGALQSYGVAVAPAGFTCNSGSTIDCVGPLGGAGDPPITTVATFQVQVYAAQPGLGVVSAYADPNGLLHESDAANNGNSLAVTVK